MPRPTKFTPELDRELLSMSPREFEARYPGLFAPGTVRKHRSELVRAGHVAAPVSRGRPPLSAALAPIVTLPTLPAPPSEEELWAAYDQMYEVYDKLESSWAVDEIDITVETDRPFGIVFMSDFHLGNAGTDTEQLRADIDLINSCPYLKAYIGGDGIDNFIIPGLAHVHRDTSLVALPMQHALFRHIVLRLLESLLAVGTGNHDAWTKKLGGIDANLAMLKDVPVLHTREACYLNLTVGSGETAQRYTIYRKHRPSKNSQNDAIAGIKHAYRFGTRVFDVGVQEHHHTPDIGSFWGHNLQRFGVRTGSYKLKDAHAREWGFMEGKVGTPVVVFHPDRRLMVPFLDLSAAIDYLEMR